MNLWLREKQKETLFLILSPPESTENLTRKNSKPVYFQILLSFEKCSVFWDLWIDVYFFILF